MTIPGGPEDITSASSIGPIQSGETKVPMGQRSFQAYMESAQTSPTQPAGASQISPLDLAQGQVPAAGPTLDTMMSQAKTAQMGLGELVQQLKTPKLRLKQSSKYILKNKLSAATAHIRSASQKMGAPVLEGQAPSAGMNPLEKFIGMITDGQGQLQQAQDQLSNLKKKGENLSPADMLQIQIKLNKAQQEIEFSSILLSKSVDDIKMMMNIQL